MVCGGVFKGFSNLSLSHHFLFSSLISLMYKALLTTIALVSINDS